MRYASVCGEIVPRCTLPVDECADCYGETERRHNEGYVEVSRGRGFSWKEPKHRSPKGAGEV